MFFDGYGRPKRLKHRASDDFRQGILCSIAAAFCLIFFKQLYVFAIVFILCAVFRFWHHSKMKRNAVKLKQIMREYGDEDEEEDEEEDERLTRKSSVGNFSRKERKARLKEYLNEIEEEFADIDDIDDDD